MVVQRFCTYLVLLAVSRCQGAPRAAEHHEVQDVSASACNADLAAFAGDDAAEDGSLALLQLRGEKKFASVAQAQEEVAAGLPPAWGQDWHRYFPEPVGNTGEEMILSGTCATFGCQQAFDVSRISRACQCFPGCEQTPFGDVCCPDYQRACTAQGHREQWMTRYLKYENANCFSGHGAENLHPADRPTQVQSAAQCSLECSKARDCTGFVMEGRSLCYLRKRIYLSECAVANGIDQHFDTYARELEDSRRSGSIVEPGWPGYDPTYRRHAGLNCYRGAGAQELDTSRPGSSQSDCAHLCSFDPRCTCFVLSAGGDCYKRSDCQLEHCVASGGAFDTYMKIRT